MNPLKQLFGQTAVYGLGVVLPRVLNYLLLTPFYTRVFEQAEYGVITELYAYVVFLLVILTYGMETGFFRYAGGSKQKGIVYSSVLTSIFVTSALFVVVAFIFSGSISEIIGYAQNREYVRWLAVIVGIDVLCTIPLARIRLENKAAKYSIIRIVEVCVNIGLNLFFLYYCRLHPESKIVQALYNESIGVGYVLISNMIASFVKLILLSGTFLGGLKYRFDRKIFRQILKYSYPLLIAGLAGTINEALDRILLKHMISPDLNPMAQLGIYGANYKMAVLMTLFVQMFKYAAEPFFFSKSGEKDSKRLYSDIMSLFVVAGLMIYLVVNVYIDKFILFIGEDFREGAHIVPVVLMANLVMGIFFNLSIWYKLTNKTIIGAVLVLTGATITIAINAIFIPSHGYVASAWAHLICYSVMVVLSYIWSRKHYRIDYKIVKIGGYILLAVAAGLIDSRIVSNLGNIGIVLKPALLILCFSVYFLMEKRTFAYYK